MFTRKMLSAIGAFAALGLGTAALAQAQTSTCPPGNAQATEYCPANVNGNDPPPAAPPAVQPPAEGQAPVVAGTLTGGTQTIEVANSSNAPGTTAVQVNLAGAGTLIVKAGDQTITVTVDASGTTTIDPGDGSQPITVGGDGGAPGTVQITITPAGVTYSLKAPGTKTVKIGNAEATIPGTATITRSSGQTTYDLKGKGDCNASLDPSVANHFNAGKNIACVIDEDTSGGRAVRAFGKGAGADIINTGNLRDRINAGPGPDLVHANSGNDLVSGGSNKDSLFGGAGNDRIFGNGSDDRLYGGPGNDRIVAGDGRDFIDGGAGNDFIKSRAESLDTIKCGPGKDTVIAGPLDKVFSDCEVVRRPF